jgi:hypothetical protein
MISLNRPRPFIFIGWEVLPCKYHFTTRNQAKLLILPEIGVARLDRTRGAVRPHPGGRLDRLAPLCQTGYRTPGLTGLHGPSRLLPILGVNTCPLFFSKACVLKNNSKDDKAVAGHFYAKDDFHRNRP